MAAHSYRAWLFQHEGLTVWNAQWYGGHHVLGYSLLFAPLAAAIGPALVGVLSALAAVVALRPARARGRAVARGGRGGRLAVHGRRALQRRDRADAVPARDRARRSARGRRARSAPARALGRARARGDAGEPGRGRVPDARRARPSCSPTGAPALRAARLARRPRARRRDRALPAVPRGRDRPLRRDRVLADARDLRRAAWRCSRPGGGRCGPAALLYLVVLVGRVRRAVAVRAERAAARRARRARRCSSLAHRRRVPVLALAVVGVGLLYLQWLPAVRAVAEAHGDPSTAPGLPGRGARLPRARGQAGRARRGAADLQPLGGRRPRQGRPARARLGAPARPEGQPDLLRRRDR